MPRNQSTDMSPVTSGSSRLSLQHAFEAEQKCLAAKFEASSPIVHHGDRGTVNEGIFIEFLRRYLPYRYAIEKATVIDSTGSVSHSIDVVIFDRHYTPTLFDSDHHRYVPAEAVYAVFECKPTFNKGYLEYAGDKVASVRQLKRTSVPIVHAGGQFPPKALFDLIGGLLTIGVEWQDGLGVSFENNAAAMTGDRSLDCGFAASGHCFSGSPRNVVAGPAAAASFIFNLLAQLQALGTVPAVDWAAYADAVGGRHV